MARRERFHMGPAYICDACGKPGWALLHTGVPCYFCDRGVFMHRRFWQLDPCPVCRREPGCTCDVCNGVGFTADPCLDLDIDELRAEWRSFAANYRRHGEVVPPQLLERECWADEL